REFNPATARKMHLEESIDVINYSKFDDSVYKKGPLWGAEQTPLEGAGPIKRLTKCPQFTVNKIELKTPLKISTNGSFIVYICVEGGAVIEVPAEGRDVERTTLGKGETVLIPADMPEFMLLPTDRDTLLLEAMVEPVEEVDPYINPDTEPFLEGEDYEGLNEPDDPDEKE
ncbi:MAG: hypothetical protein LUC24_04105, partial [Bacteroidales bacterium]|nr:hypothetical protein [Bacteroidales bacterium]